MAVSTVDHSLSILLLSRNVEHKLQLTRDTVKRVVVHDEIRTCLDVTAARQLIVPEQWYPDLVIVHQDWPGQYSAAEVRELLTLLPLARWICVRGAWCEADGRNGSPWPEAVCIREREAELRIQLECAVLQGDIDALPLTASRDELFAFTRLAPKTGDTAINHATQFSILVLSCDLEWRRSIDDLLVVEGYRPVQSPSSEIKPAAIVWDADPVIADTASLRWANGSDECSALSRHVHSVQDTGSNMVVIAVVTMAYPQDVERLLASGATAVIEKSQLAEALSPSLRDALCASPKTA